VLNSLNKFLLGLWIVSLTVLIFVVLNIDKQPNIEMVEGKEINPNPNPNEQQIQVNQQLEEPLEVTQPVNAVQEEPKIMKESVRLAMLGDILLHLRLAQYKDFTSSFKFVSPIMQSYDYLIANQESLPVGNKYALSGYPQFSSPPHIIRDMQNAGVDMVTIANNHTVDKGEGGVRTLFENLESYHMPYVGAYQSNEDAMQHRVIELGSIKIGMLAYTYGTNGLYLPKGSPFIINYFDEAKMTADIERLKKEVDVVAVSMHWGTEYVTHENDYQRHMTNVLNQAGADVVFGTHPHVLQPYKRVVNEQGHETHVFYSLGNFFSTILIVPDTMIGGIGSLEITKEGETVSIGNPQFDATTVLKDSDGIYRIYPLKDVEERAVQNLQWVKTVLGEEVTVY
jgi:hypothetical protein